jgi:hypothetical protein
MTWTTHFHDDHAEVRYSGNVSGEDILEAKRAFFDSPQSRAAVYVLCDFTAVEKLDVRAPDVQRILRQDLASVPSHPRLIEVVIAPQTHAFGLARMWEQQVHDERRTLVVRERPEAELWLKEQGMMNS